MVLICLKFLTCSIIHQKELTEFFLRSHYAHKYFLYFFTYYKLFYVCFFSSPPWLFSLFLHQGFVISKFPSQRSDRITLACQQYWIKQLKNILNPQNPCFETIIVSRPEANASYFLDSHCILDYIIARLLRLTTWCFPMNF